MRVYKFWDIIKNKYLPACDVYPCSSMNNKTEWVRLGDAQKILGKVHHHKKAHIELHECELSLVRVHEPKPEVLNE